MGQMATSQVGNIAKVALQEKSSGKMSKYSKYSEQKGKIFCQFCTLSIITTYYEYFIFKFEWFCIVFGFLMLHIPLIIALCGFFFLLFIFSFYFFQSSALWPVDKDSDTVWSSALTTGGCIQEAVVLKQSHT